MLAVVAYTTRATHPDALLGPFPAAGHDFDIQGQVLIVTPKTGDIGHIPGCLQAKI